MPAPPPSIWGNINTAQTASWQSVNSAQTASWAAIVT